MNIIIQICSQFASVCVSVSPACVCVHANTSVFLQVQVCLCVCHCVHTCRVRTCLLVKSPGFKWSRHTKAAASLQAQGQTHCLKNDRCLPHTTLRLTALWARCIRAWFTANELGRGGNFRRT